MVPRMSPAEPHYDAVVVGAGPYGLSVSAHLLGRGLSVGVFGKTLEFWRQHMPKGMLLRSHWWATHLSDPSRRFGFDRFFESAPGHGPGYPVPIETFIKYGQWFQERAVPAVDETYVTSVARDGNGFSHRARGWARRQDLGGDHGGGASILRQAARMVQPRAVDIRHPFERSQRP
jgi:cation diffusion facilitator CzcD-associated flavoprotein CzcO